jgi:hypothetical protein
LTLPATLFGTTVRVLRTAAGRRALQLVLLVGGLFLLGFLCGEQAHAAEGTPVAPVARAAPVAPAAPVTAALSETGHPSDSVRTATEHVVTPVRAVAEHVVTPVRTAVNTATRALDEVQAKAAAPSGEPELRLPSLPEVSEPTVPVLPAPDVSEPLPQRHGGDAAHAPSAPGHDTHPDARTQARTAPAAAPVSAAPYGPAAPQASSPAHAPAHRAGVPAAPGHPVPAPTGDPDGVLGKQAADGMSFRHGDAQAVTPADRAPLRLVPGAAARADAPHTRERHRDIPVFPG